MHPFQPIPRRKKTTSLHTEQLESRELLTGGAGDTFAIVPGEITKANQPAVIKFTIDSTHFTVPKGKFTLGVDIVKDPTSTLKPMIGSLNNANGIAIMGMKHSAYAAKLSNATVAPGSTTSAVLAPIQMDSHNPVGTTTYSVKVRGLQGTTGKFLLGFFLPGDANGDGKVDTADLTKIKSLLGQRGGTSAYSFDADTNRDGRIGKSDVKTAMDNMGVSTTITPTISANLDPASVTTLTARVTTARVVHFTGVTTPGAAVKFTETAQKSQPVATTADAKGNYSLFATLGDGSNTFKVTTLDAFGQSISGNLAPVTFQTSAAVTLASLNQTGTTVKKA